MTYSKLSDMNAHTSSLICPFKIKALKKQLIRDLTFAYNNLLITTTDYEQSPCSVNVTAQYGAVAILDNFLVKFEFFKVLRQFYLLFSTICEINVIVK